MKDMRNVPSVSVYSLSKEVKIGVLGGAYVLQGSEADGSCLLFGRCVTWRLSIGIGLSVVKLHLGKCMTNNPLIYWVMVLVGELQCPAASWGTIQTAVNEGWGWLFPPLPLGGSACAEAWHYRHLPWSPSYGPIHVWFLFIICHIMANLT